jgi:hypothetical protein
VRLRLRVRAAEKQGDSDRCYAGDAGRREPHRKQHLPGFQTLPEFVLPAGLNWPELGHCV